MYKIIKDPKLCKCGCGEITSNVWSKNNTWIHGHNRRGTKMSEATRRKCIESGLVFQDKYIIDERKMKQLYLIGLSCLKVAKIFKCSETFINVRVRNLGISRSFSDAQVARNREIKMNDDNSYVSDDFGLFEIIPLDEKKLKRLYLSGLTYREVAKIMRCGWCTVRERAIKLGIARSFSKAQRIRRKRERENK